VARLPQGHQRLAGLTARSRILSCPRDEIHHQPARLFDVGPRGARQSRRALFKYFAFLVALVTVYAVLFHVIKLSVENEPHSWITGFYWTLVVMTTLGFGDITFKSDIGRVFSIIVLLSGVVFLLVMLPFLFTRR
jgi:hypothetical protein